MTSTHVQYLRMWATASVSYLPVYCRSFLKKKKKKVKKGSVQSDSLLIIMNSLTMSATYMYSNVADNCRKHPSVDALYEGFNGLN